MTLDKEYTRKKFTEISSAKHFEFFGKVKRLSILKKNINLVDFLLNNNLLMK